jgi:TPR repeat protein
MNDEAASSWSDDNNKLRAAAERGEAGAQLLLGNSLYETWWPAQGPTKLEEAIKWLKAAAEQGVWQAEDQLAEVYTRINFNGSRWTAIKQLRINAAKHGAESGDTSQQYKWAKILKEGKLVEQNTHEAVEWLRKAAESNQLAQWDLAEMLRVGDTVPCDKSEATYWYRKAVEWTDAHEFIAKQKEFVVDGRLRPDPEKQYKLGCVLIKLVATDVGFSPNSGTNADIA